VFAKIYMCVPPGAVCVPSQSVFAYVCKRMCLYISFLLFAFCVCKYIYLSFAFCVCKDICRLCGLYCCSLLQCLYMYMYPYISVYINVLCAASAVCICSLLQCLYMSVHIYYVLCGVFLAAAPGGC
jgi:hypothetical protein